MLPAFLDKPSRKELEQSCAELRALVEKQQAEINGNNRHIAHLTEKNRKWSSEYIMAAATAAVKETKKKESSIITSLRAKIDRLEKENLEMAGRVAKLLRRVDKPRLAERKLQSIDRQPKALPKPGGEEIQLPDNMAEIKFSNEMQMTLAKYAKLG